MLTDNCMNLENLPIHLLSFDPHRCEVVNQLADCIGIYVSHWWTSKCRLLPGALLTGKLPSSRRTLPRGVRCLKPLSRRGMTILLDPQCLDSSSLWSSDHVCHPNLHLFMFNLFYCHFCHFPLECIPTYSIYHFRFRKDNDYTSYHFRFQYYYIRTTIFY